MKMPLSCMISCDGNTISFEYCTVCKVCCRATCCNPSIRHGFNIVCNDADRAGI